MGVKNWTRVVPWRKGSLDELDIPAIAIDVPNYINRRLHFTKRHQWNYDRVPLTHVTLTLGTIKSALKCNILPVLVFDGPPEHLKRNPNPDLVHKAHGLYKRFTERRDPYDKELAELLYSSPALKAYFAASHLRDICHAIGVPAITAPSEAEMTAAVLCCDGKVGTVVSNDADALLFGSVHVCKNLSLSKNEMECVTQSEVLNEVNLDLEQMRDLAILCGCDFHKKGVKGVGPRKGAKLLRRHGSLERVLNAKGLLSSEKEEYLIAREVFDEVHYINSDNYNLTLKAPIESKVKRMLTVVRGRKWAEKTTDELVKLRKRFGQVQATLEAWC